MDRPRLSFYRGTWSLVDEDAGYRRILTLAELNHLLADGKKHIEMTLRTATVRPPMDVEDYIIGGGVPLKQAYRPKPRRARVSTATLAKRHRALQK